MSAEVLIFDILGAIAILSALGVVLAKNPVYSAISLVVTFVNVAAIYVMLRAEFLAAVQIIVYTGAILVLVLFVLMLVHQEDLPEFHGGRPVQRILAFVLGLILFGEVAAAILTRSVTAPADPVTPILLRLADGDTVKALGMLLYSQYVLPIQVTALILLVATIGALVLARPEPSKVRSGLPSRVLSISLGHPRESDVDGATAAALPSTTTKPEAGERELVLTKSADEFVDQVPGGSDRANE